MSGVVINFQDAVQIMNAAEQLRWVIPQAITEIEELRAALREAIRRADYWETRCLEAERRVVIAEANGGRHDHPA